MTNHIHGQNFFFWPVALTSNGSKYNSLLGLYSADRIVSKVRWVEWQHVRQSINQLECQWWRQFQPRSTRLCSTRHARFVFPSTRKILLILIRNIKLLLLYSTIYFAYLFVKLLCFCYTKLQISESQFSQIKRRRSLTAARFGIGNEPIYAKSNANNFTCINIKSFDITCHMFQLKYFKVDI